MLVKNQTVQGRRYNFQNNSGNSQERDIWQKGSILFPYINLVKNLIENMLELLCGMVCLINKIRNLFDIV